MERNLRIEALYWAITEAEVQGKSTIAEALRLALVTVQSWQEMFKDKEKTHA